MLIEKEDFFIILFAKGLIKSRSVLSEDYGSIHIYIGELVPMSRFIQGKINRVENASIPRYMYMLIKMNSKIRK